MIIEGMEAIAVGAKILLCGQIEIISYTSIMYYKYKKSMNTLSLYMK
jgi:hypothetical protein